jgi:hypothetical protein
MAPPMQPANSYVIAPGTGFSYPRGNPIALGNVFENALKLDEIPISFRDTKTLPPKVHPPDMEGPGKITGDQGTKGSIEAWAEYFSTFGARLGAEQAKNTHVVYNINKTLKTDSFTGQGLLDYFQKRGNDEVDLQKYLRKGPIYMVTGIKYSTDLKWEIIVGKTSKAEGGLHGKVKEDLQGGAWRTVGAAFTVVKSARARKRFLPIRSTKSHIKGGGEKGSAAQVEP